MGIRYGLLTLFIALTVGAQPPGRVFPWPDQYQRHECKGPFVLDSNGNTDFLISVETVAGEGLLEIAAAWITPPVTLTNLEGMALDDAAARLVAGKQGCGVTLARPANEGRRGAIHIKVPGTRPVIVKEGSRSWIAAPDCLSYQNRILADSGRINALMVATYMYRSGTFGTRDLSHHDDILWASVAGWRNHWTGTGPVLERSKIQESEYGPNARAVVLDAVITKQGDVTSVKCRSQFAGAERLVRAAAAMKMKPFDSDGSPVEVLAHIPLLLGESGNIFILY